MISGALRMELMDLNFFRLLMSTSFDQHSKICFFSDFHSKQDWKTCVNSCSPITMQTNFDSNWLILYISRGPLFWWWIQKSCKNVCKGGIIANHTIILWDWFTLWDREEDIQSRRKMTKHFIHDLILVDLFPFFPLCKNS